MLRIMFSRKRNHEIYIQNSKEITNHKTFKVFILFLIFLSAILAGIETYLDSAERHRMILLLLDNFIVYCFTVEILLKILAMGKKPWLFF